MSVLIASGCVLVVVVTALLLCAAGMRDDGLDRRFWGPPPTRWQLFTARLWHAWMKLRREH